MFHGSLRYEEKRKNVSAKCSLQLPGCYFLDGILRMLLGGIVDDDIEPAEFIDGLLHGCLTEFFIANVTIDKQTFAALLFHKLLRFPGIFVFL